MLVLHRKAGESIFLPTVNVELKVIEIRRNRVVLGIQAPRGLAVVRDDCKDTQGIDLKVFTGGKHGDCGGESES